MLNPVNDKYVLEFSTNFFDTDFVKKYDNYLFHKNYPVKLLQDHVHSTFKSISVPGIGVIGNTVSGISNLNKTSISNQTTNMTETSINRSYVGTQPFDELIKSKVLNIACESTLLNWMYFYEYFRGYYQRDRKVTDFKVFMTVMDQADVPMLQFIFSDCFISDLPDLLFESSNITKEPRYFDLSVSFNKFDTKLIIPDFNLKNVTL